MNIDEMHIKVRQDLQKLDSFANANLLPEEVDFHLNYFTAKYVDNVVGKLKGSPTTPTEFQHNQRLLDSISSLQVKNYTLTSRINSTEDNLVYGVLPPNYKHLISSASDIVCTDKPKNQVDAKEYLHLLSFLAENDTFENLEIKINDIILFSLSAYKQFEDGIDDADIKYQLINIILSNVPNAYWEYYEGKYYKNSFIIVSTSPIAIQVTVNDDLVDVSEDLSSYKIYRYYSEDKTKRIGNRVVKDENLNFTKHHPFEKTVWESPLATLGNGVVFVYEDNEFKVKSILIDYIRKPLPVSYVNKVNSDLPEEAQQQIVEQTIIHMKGIIQDPSWQTAMQHNQINNQ